MGLFGKLFKKEIQPEDQYNVIITDESIKVEHPKRQTELVLWEDLHTVFLINTDQGPQLPDVWLTLVGDIGGCIIPQGCKGFEDVYEIVSKFKGFNFDNFIASMSSAENGEFLLWTKNDSSLGARSTVQT